MSEFETEVLALLRAINTKLDILTGATHLTQSKPTVSASQKKGVIPNSELKEAAKQIAHDVMYGKKRAATINRQQNIDRICKTVGDNFRRYIKK